VAFVLLVTLRGLADPRVLVAYMEHDVTAGRFFAYLNLFVAAMLLLVLADSYLLLYVGWRGVGLASYLLIRVLEPEAGVRHHAAKKSFVVNRSATWASRSPS
jgi:NADH-quinone oxidoreductase subunit L